MKAQLIQLSDYNIVVNGGEIEKGDLYIYKDTKTNEYLMDKEEGPFKNHKWTCNKLNRFELIGKVIASDNLEQNLPTIDYNGFEKELKELKDKKFSLGDIKRSIELARLMKDNECDDFDTESISGLTELCTYGLQDKYSDEEIIRLIQKPKVFDIEGEIEDSSFKVTKIIK